MSSLGEVLADLLRRQAETDRRLDNMVRHGRVAEVDPKAGTVRLRIGGTDEKPLLSPPIPYGQMAGALKLHSPPSVGQQMTMLSPTGDFQQAAAFPFTWSDNNASPNDKGDEHTLTFGDVRIDLKAGGAKVTVGGFSLDLTTSGAKFLVGGVEHDISSAGLNTKGGKIKHDEKNIGSDHNHGGVMIGNGKTAGPEA